MRAKGLGFPVESSELNVKTRNPEGYTCSLVLEGRAAKARKEMRPPRRKSLEPGHALFKSHNLIKSLVVTGNRLHVATLCPICRPGGRKGSQMPKTGSPRYFQGPIKGSIRCTKALRTARKIRKRQKFLPKS